MGGVVAVYKMHYAPDIRCADDRARVGASKVSVSVFSRAIVALSAERTDVIRL